MSQLFDQSETNKSKHNIGRTDHQKTKTSTKTCKKTNLTEATYTWKTMTF